MIIMIGMAARWLDLHAGENKYWLSICNHEMKKPRFPMLFQLQVSLPSICIKSLTIYFVGCIKIILYHSGPFGWIIFCDGVLINISPAAETRTASITPIYQLVHC